MIKDAQKKYYLLSPWKGESTEFNMYLDILTKFSKKESSFDKQNNHEKY